ncbi:hypothetical protein [Sphingomonas sp. KR3-1]|uniref:lipopolysaccharide biosynthesis protein n=1 Tax=Sphingomonas sp. KR3-1 TaxID=3156611 RepID=UPI0032B4AD40
MMRRTLSESVVRLAGAPRRLFEGRAAGLIKGRHAAVAGLISIGLRAFLLFGKFAFIVVLAKFTDTSTVGIYALLVTIVTIAIYIIGLEIHTFTTREIVSDHSSGHGGVHIQSHLLTLAGIFGIAVPIVWGFTFWLGIAGKFNFLLLAAIILLETFGQELGRYLLVLSRPVASNLLQFIRGAAWMPFPIIMLLTGHRVAPVDTILLGWLGGGILACLFGFWSIRAYLRTLHPYRLAWLSRAFFSARHYFVVAMLTQVQYYSDRFIVQRVMGEAAVGVLSFYQSFANTMVTFVQTGVISVMLPRLLLAAKQDDRAAESRVRRAMFGWAMVLAVSISGSLAIGLPFLLRQMNKMAYVADLPVFYVLLFGNVILVAGLVVHLSLYARRRDSDLMRVSLILIPLALLVNILIVPLLGIAGAACTFVATAVLDFLVKYWLLTRQRR